MEKWTDVAIERKRGSETETKNAHTGDKKKHLRKKKCYPYLDTINSRNKIFGSRDWLGARLLDFPVFNKFRDLVSIK